MIDYEISCGPLSADGRLDSFLQLDGRRSDFKYDNRVLDNYVRMREVSFEGFSYMSQDMTWPADGAIDFYHDCDEPYVIFSVARSGALNKWLDGDDVWQSGDANLSYMQSSYRTRWILVPGGSFRQGCVVMPLSFIRRMSARYPEVFGPMVSALEGGDMRKVTPANWQATRAEARMIDDIEASFVMGNAAADYALSRILDCLSPSLYRVAGVDASEPFSLAVRDKMHAARDIVDLNLASPLSLHELAGAVGTNECTLKRAFKEEFGLTVFGYIYSVRMRRAAHMLAETTLALADIALSLGYDHLSHFSTAFRRLYGVPPSQFRHSGGR